MADGPLTKAPSDGGNQDDLSETRFGSAQAFAKAPQDEDGAV